MKNVVAATFVTAVAVMSVACAGTVPEEPRDEGAAPNEQPGAAEEQAAPPPEENVAQTSSPLCLHRCVEIWGGCRVCYCESGDARVICYPIAVSAAAATAAPDAPPPSLTPAEPAASP